MSRRLRDVAGSAIIAGGITIMNVTTYGLTLVAARVLGPVDFGEFSSVLGTLIILNVLSLGLQAAGARRIASDPEGRVATASDIRRITVRAGVLIALIGVVASPVVTALLDLEHTGTAVALALAAALLTLMGGLSGILQGEEHWVALSSVYTTMGVARLAGGLVALAISPSALSLCVGVAVAASAPVMVAHAALRRTGQGGSRSPVSADPDARAEAPGGTRLWHEVAHNSHALLAFFVLSNIDVVAARALIPDVQAGLYASGLVLTKAVLFLPQFVVIVAFPAMAQRVSGRRTHASGLAVVGIIGAAATAGVAALSRLALEFVGGEQYSSIQASLPMFAVVGTLLAMTQVLVYSAIAGRHARSVWLVWATVGAFVVVALTADSATELLHFKLVADVVLLLALSAYVFTRSDDLTVRRYEPSLVEDSASPEQPPVR